jgi:TRAP-type C4-dicarboxylate transport system permease small subunit
LIATEADFRRGKRRTRTGIRVPVALVCVALLAVLAFVQVTHLHSNQTDADQCPLCVVMHAAAPVAVAAAAVVIVPLGVHAPQAEPLSLVRRPSSSLFIRPPPAGC